MLISGNAFAKKNPVDIYMVLVKISKYLMMSPPLVIHQSGCLNFQITESSFAGERIVAISVILKEFLGPL